MMALLTIFLGGGVGAVLRFLLDQLIQQYAPYYWLGILIVNLLGATAFFLYYKYSLPSHQNFDLFILTGLLGGLTTFSTFSFQAVSLLLKGHWGQALSVVLLNVVLGILIGVFILSKKFL